MIKLNIFVGNIDHCQNKTQFKIYSMEIMINILIKNKNEREVPVALRKYLFRPLKVLTKANAKRKK